MNLLHEELPLFSLRPRVPVAEFFSRCIEIAEENGWAVDRRAQDVEQLNVHVGGARGTLPLVRMVEATIDADRLVVDVVFDGGPGEYERYVPAAKAECRRLLQAYNRRHGTNLRVGVPRRGPVFDSQFVDRGKLLYAQEKFDAAVHELAVGEGDVRTRLQDAATTLAVVQPSDLPPPLDVHLKWVREKLTSREPRFDGQSRLSATLGAMQNATGRGIAERIVQIRNLIHEVLASVPQ